MGVDFLRMIGMLAERGGGTGEDGWTTWMRIKGYSGADGRTRTFF